MRFKTDENLHPEIADLLRAQGHDAVTVWDQQMQGARDPRVGEVCRTEGRVLVTLDLDFADIRKYPPEQYPGFLVLRPSRHSRKQVRWTLQRVLPLLGSEPLTGRLWIVERGEIRIRGGQGE